MNGETYGERIDIKSVIMEVLSIVGGESVDIERIMGKLRNNDAWYALMLKMRYANKKKNVFRAAYTSILNT